MPDDIKHRKTPVTLEVDADLLEEAQAPGLSLPEALKESLARRVKDARLRQAQEEMRPVIDSMNAFHARHGDVSDEYNDL